MFHNLLGCMELLPGLHAVFAIPNMNALPVHCANQVFQVSPISFFLSDFSVVFSRVFGGSRGVFGVILGSFRGPFGRRFDDF